METEKYDPEKSRDVIHTMFSNKTDTELVQLFNSQVGNSGWTSSRASYLQELKLEFQRRDWDISIIATKTGGLKLAAGNTVYLKENKLFLVHE